MSEVNQLVLDLFTIQETLKASEARKEKAVMEVNAIAGTRRDLRSVLRSKLDAINAPPVFYRRISGRIFRIARGTGHDAMWIEEVCVLQGDDPL